MSGHLYLAVVFRNCKGGDLETTPQGGVGELYAPGSAQLELAGGFHALIFTKVLPYGQRKEVWEQGLRARLFGIYQCVFRASVSWECDVVRNCEGECVFLVNGYRD